MISGRRLSEYGFVQIGHSVIVLRPALAIVESVFELKPILLALRFQDYELCSTVETRSVRGKTALYLGRVYKEFTWFMSFPCAWSGFDMLPGFVIGTRK